MRATTLPAVLAVLSLFPLPTIAGDPAGLGTWDIVAVTPDGEMPSVLTLSTVGGRLKAEVELGGTVRDVSDESLVDGVLSMNVLYDGTQYAIEGRIDGDTMDGTWSGGGNSGTLKAKRRPVAN